MRQASQRLHGALHFVAPGQTGAQSQTVRIFVLRREELAWHDGDAAIERIGGELQRIHGARQFGPQQKAAAGARQTRAVGVFLLYGVGA